MGSCLSKSGKKTKDEDDDRMPYSPPDAPRKGKYKIQTAQHGPAKDNVASVSQEKRKPPAREVSPVREMSPVRTDPPVIKPPPPPVLQQSPVLTQASPEGAAYASYPVESLSDEQKLEGPSKANISNEPPQVLKDSQQPTTSSKTAVIKPLNNITPAKEASPTRSSLAAAKSAQREMKSIPVATPTVPGSFATESEIKRLDKEVKMDEQLGTPFQNSSKVIQTEIKTSQIKSLELDLNSSNSLTEKPDSDIMSKTDKKEAVSPVSPVSTFLTTKVQSTYDTPKPVVEGSVTKSINKTEQVMIQVGTSTIQELQVEKENTEGLFFHNGTTEGIHIKTENKPIVTPDKKTVLYENYPTKSKTDIIVNGTQIEEQNTALVPPKRVPHIEVSHKKEIHKKDVTETDKNANKQVIVDNDLNKKNTSEEVKTSPVLSSPISPVSPVHEISKIQKLSQDSMGTEKSIRKFTESTSSGISSGEETGSWLASPVASPEPAFRDPSEVSVTIRSDYNEQIRPSIKETLETTNGHVTESTGIDVDASSTGPINSIKLAIQNSLYDGTQVNMKTIESHSFQRDTRKTVLQNVDKWMNNNKENRVCIIHGDGGIGKSCLAVEICSRYKNSIAGYHFLDYKCENSKHNLPRNLIQSLTLMMCNTVSGFVHGVPSGRQLEYMIEHGKLEEIYEQLFRSPVSSLECENKLIVIDALDQCDPNEKESFLQILSSFQDSMPDWLSLIILTRSDNRVIEMFGGSNVFHLKHNNENASDMKRVLKDALGSILDRISLDGGLNQLVKKSGGSMLYCAMIKQIIFSEMAGQKIVLRNVDRIFPNELYGLFNNRFRKFKEIIEGLGNPTDYSTILGPIAFSVGPISEFYLSQIFGDLVVESQEAIGNLFPLVTYHDGQYDIAHKSVWEMLLDEQSGDLALDIKAGLDQVASLCYTVAQNTSVTNELGNFKCYALKHVIYHLLNVPKQQERIAKILCNLSYIQSKLNMPGITIKDILDDYHHEHWRILPSGDKYINLETYMKKHPRQMEQIFLYESFLIHKNEELELCSDDVLQIAANCSSVPAIQQAARAFMSSKAWLENITNIPDTNSVIRKVEGDIIDADLSTDGKNFATISQNNDTSTLLLYNAQNGELKEHAIDLISIPDREGVLIKFIPETQNIFVGSLTTFVSVRGKSVQSGLDVGSVSLKTKYSIECCDASSKYFVAALNTLPFNGRSVHLSIFDLKSKKCLKTLEILKFRFGGSSQFGVKACCLGKDKPLVVAGIKQSAKPVLLVNVWSITKWQQVSSVEISDNSITRCVLSGDTVVFGASTRSYLQSGAHRSTPIIKWEYKKNQPPQMLDQCQKHGTLSSGKSQIALGSWNSRANKVELTLYTGNFQQAQSSYVIRGVPPASELFCEGKQVVAVIEDHIKFYNMDDLAQLEDASYGQANNSLYDMMASELLFIPKSETLAVVTRNEGNDISVKLWESKQGDINDILTTPFDNECFHSETKTSNIFGRRTSILQSSADGNFLLLNNGTTIKVWNRILNTVKELPLSNTSGSIIWSTPSTKDNILAVICQGNNDVVELYDLKTCTRLKQINASSEITDFSIIPAQANVLTYHGTTNGQLQVFSIRTGVLLSQANYKLCYGRISAGLDRMVIVSSNDNKKGNLILRSSDDKITHDLETPAYFNPDPKLSDLEFSTDGTILIGTCAHWDVCRIWNGGNGEILNDLPVTGMCTVPGMLTNTHVVLQSDRLTVVDVASGEVTTVAPFSGGVLKPSPNSLCFSPKSTVLAACDDNGFVTVFIGHNYNQAKRQTTLQRIKSFRKK